MKSSFWKKYRSLQRIWHPFSQSGASNYAACSGFYILLSAAPCAVLLLRTVPVTSTVALVWRLLEGLLPKAVVQALENALRSILNHQNTAAVSLSALALLWSAGKGVSALIDGLLVMSGGQNMSYWRKRFLGMACFLLMLLSLGLILSLLVFGEQLVQLLIWLMPGLTLLFKRLLLLRFIYAFLILSSLFVILYRLSAAFVRFRHCLLGACFAALGWLLFSYVFSLYVNHFQTYTVLYGSLGLWILLAVWLHICLSLLFYGMVLSYQVSCCSYAPAKIIRDTFSSRS